MGFYYMRVETCLPIGRDSAPVSKFTRLLRRLPSLRTPARPRSASHIAPAFSSSRRPSRDFRAQLGLRPHASLACLAIAQRRPVQGSEILLKPLSLCAGLSAFGYSFGITPLLSRASGNVPPAPSRTFGCSIFAHPQKYLAHLPAGRQASG